MSKPFSGRVIFDHLPKTAGQAINAWLMSELGSSCVTKNLIGEHRDLIQQYGGQYSVISSHIYFDDQRGLDPRYQYLTCLRNPIDRVVSWLFFVANNHDDSQIPELRISMRSFYESDGRDILDILINHISNVYVEHFCRINGTGFESDDEKINNALAGIKQYDIVGIYEDLPLFFADVAALIGLPVPQEILKINVTNQRPHVNQLSPALLARIIELNQLDLRLYAEVVEWKRSVEENKSAQLQALKVKYEPVPERVLITEYCAILTAVLREGSDIPYGSLINFDVDFSLAREVKDLEMGIYIFDSHRQCIFGMNSSFLEQSYLSVANGSYRVSYYLIANLPAGNYTVSFAFAERLPEGGQRELAWRDVMCEFQVYQQVSKPFMGTCYLPTQISLNPTGLMKEERKVTHFVGYIECVTSVQSMVASQQVNIDVTIVNRSEQIWVGDSLCPVRLCYHWLKATGEAFVFDGLRSPLPSGGVASGQAIDTKMKIVAPNEVGIYILVLTLVQEHVRWFDENVGFETARLTVDVTKKQLLANEI